MKPRLALLLALLFGMVLGVAVSKVLPKLPLMTGASEVPVLIIPAVVSEDYSYLQRRGFTAVLVSGNRQRLEFPVTWLPSKVKQGDKLHVTTQIQTSLSSTTFAATIEAAE